MHISILIKKNKKAQEKCNEDTDTFSQSFNFSGSHE
jgi:hypothetical protein